MNIAWRIRRSFFREENKLADGNGSLNGSSSGKEEGKDELLGVTDELIDHVRSFTIDTFKDFSLAGNQSFGSQFCSCVFNFYLLENKYELNFS